MSKGSATRMPPEVAETHEMLSRELSFLYTKWNVYKSLYCADDKTVRLLEYAASFFFEILHEVLRDDIILTVCRLTDRATSKVRRQDKHNLTIAYLASLIPDSESDLQKDVGSKCDGVIDNCKRFREHRNRRVGHYDFDTKTRRSHALLPNISIPYGDVALKRIADVLNVIEQHYDDNERSYQVGIYGTGDAADLIEFIDGEQRLRKYLHD